MGWHEVKAKDSTKAWKLRNAVNQRNFAIEMIITSSVHTLLKISTGKTSHLQAFANEFKHSYKTAQGRPPNTITSHCNWVMDTRFKQEHEVVCEECDEAMSANDVKAKKAIATNNEANRINRENMEAEVDVSVVKEMGADVILRTPISDTGTFKSTHGGARQGAGRPSGTTDSDMGKTKKVQMDVALPGDDYEKMSMAQLEEREEYHFTQYSKVEEIIKKRKADKASMAHEIQRVTSEIQERKKLEFDTEVDAALKEITAKYGGV